MPDRKERHGCLTAWLVLVILANGFTALATPLSVASIQEALPDFPAWIVWPIAGLALLNILFAVALFNWKRWGFYGFVATSLAACALNLYAGLGIFDSVRGLIGIAVLYGVLQIGGKKSGWAQLDGGGRRRDPDDDRYGLECSICGTPLNGGQRHVGLCRRCQQRAA